MKKFASFVYIAHTIGASLILLMLLNVTIHTVIFEADACIAPISKSKYKLCDNFVSYVDGEKIIVPKGFMTNLTHIPRIVWVIYGEKYDSLANPITLHDYMYQCPGGHSRQYIDDVFYSALIQNNVDGVGAGLFWIALKFFGKDSFFINKGNKCNGNIKAMDRKAGRA